MSTTSRMTTTGVFGLWKSTTGGNEWSEEIRKNTPTADFQKSFIQPHAEKVDLQYTIKYTTLFLALLIKCVSVQVLLYL